MLNIYIDVKINITSTAYQKTSISNISKDKIVLYRSIRIGSTNWVCQVKNVFRDWGQWRPRSACASAVWTGPSMYANNQWILPNVWMESQARMIVCASVKSIQDLHWANNHWILPSMWMENQVRMIVCAPVKSIQDLHWANNHWILPNVWMDSQGLDDTLCMSRRIWICSFYVFPKTIFHLI